MNEKLLKSQEVADILQISLSYAYQLIREGKISVVRMGRAVRVRESDLYDFILENTSKDEFDTRKSFEFDGMSQM